MAITFSGGFTLSGGIQATPGEAAPTSIQGVLLHTLTNPNNYGTSAGDYFGYSVAISGNRAIVGAFGEDDAGGLSSGVAYIYDVTTGGLLHTLTNPNNYSTSANDNFGRSVSISGDRAIVSAYGEDDTGGTQSGAAYIYDVTTGGLLHTLTNPNVFNTSGGDEFGISVSISGDRAIVGAYQEDDAGGLSSGAAYIFDVTTGGLLHTLTNPNAYSTSANDNFGRSVSISGDRAIVGAWFDDALGVREGRAYIYDVTTGGLLHTLTNPNPDGVGTDDHYGFSVAISGDRAIVGAYGENHGGTATYTGKAYIYDVITGGLVYTLDNPEPSHPSIGSLFGLSVAISDNRAIVGAYYADDSGDVGSGAAYIFDVTTGGLLHTLTNPNNYGTSAGDQFGISVSISGDRAIVGAYQEDDAGGTESGAAYIYQ